MTREEYEARFFLRRYKIEVLWYRTSLELFGITVIDSIGKVWVTSPKQYTRLELKKKVKELELFYYNHYTKCGFR